ncbi:hypothetical protein JTE90_017086 [Oedothorax gibbosus]|uniref:Lipocalin/cytosolic fatty-acid binding domain-containing protein n=1 Tax=Oedothorax gibbosus TaxID=931172 RepID=A0AAV6TP13_9ARAC|nr:hypothetical protein JTE90_017086 [Oedothorax gibbosus]
MFAQVILVLGLSATALSLHIGMCPELTLDKAFDLEKFTGTWYLVEVSHNSMEALPKNCSQFLIENITDTEASVMHKFKSRITKKWDTEFFEFTADEKEPGLLKFNVINGTKETLPFHKKFPLRVVDTDYDTYAILLACQELFIFTRRK